MYKSPLITKLLENSEFAGYQSPGGRITYNKVIDSKSFAQFTDIIESIIPLNILFSDKSEKIPSITRIIPGAYPKYLYVNSTADEYQDYEDQEAMTELLDKLDTKPIYGICVQRNQYMQSAHACAFIVWKTNKYKFAFYDPLDYKKGKRSFNFAETAFKSERFNEKIEFINLNTYCFHKIPEEFHCSQYVINAEYCYLYSMYFLDKWLEFGAKLHRATFQKTIKATYIVKPDMLTRANNKESMIYRVIMMSYICKSFIEFLGGLKTAEKRIIKDSQKNIIRLREYVENIKNLYDIYLI